MGIGEPSLRIIGCVSQLICDRSSDRRSQPGLRIPSATLPTHRNPLRPRIYRPPGPLYPRGPEMLTKVRLYSRFVLQKYVFNWTHAGIKASRVLGCGENRRNSRALWTGIGSIPQPRNSFMPWGYVTRCVCLWRISQLWIWVCAFAWRGHVAQS